jgi:hypothetical protein
MISVPTGSTFGGEKDMTGHQFRRNRLVHERAYKKLLPQTVICMMVSLSGPRPIQAKAWYLRHHRTFRRISVRLIDAFPAPWTLLFATLQRPISSVKPGYPRFSIRTTAGGQNHLPRLDLALNLFRQSVGRGRISDAGNPNPKFGSQLIPAISWPRSYF